MSPLTDPVPSATATAAAAAAAWTPLPPPASALSLAALERKGVAASEFDIIVVGAGILGASLAKALAEDGRRVLLLERDLNEPDRIVGELLQPGGVISLKKLGLEDCLENIDSIDVNGYGVIQKGEMVHIPYPKGFVGRSFHHGRFIQKLRYAAANQPRVTLVEATVTSLITNEDGSISGVRVRASSGRASDEPVRNLESDASKSEEKELRAPLTIVADGCFSKFRKALVKREPQTRSHFIGLILNNCTLPWPNHGHVVLASPSPILLYQIGSNDVRILVDIPGTKLPKISDGSLQAYLLDKVLPQLPASVQEPFRVSLKDPSQRLRSMPNSFLPPSMNNTTGAILLGDAMNMRHPLTGGGMTVAFSDAVLVREMIRSVPDLHAAHAQHQILSSVQELHWERKGLSSVINILAMALYTLFSAPDDNPEMLELRQACFSYFQLGGDAVAGPVSLLAGINPAPSVLVWHFFAVAWHGAKRIVFKADAPWWSIPINMFYAIRVIFTAAIVIGPLIISEMRS